MKAHIKKFFYGVLACCLAFGFQSACGAVLCVGADGHVSIEMTCGSPGFPQSHGAASLPFCPDRVAEQDGDAGCDRCAMDIPIPGVPAGLRSTPSDPSLLLMPVYHLSALRLNDPNGDERKAASNYGALAVRDHSIAMLHTTVLLI